MKWKKSEAHPKNKPKMSIFLTKNSPICLQQSIKTESAIKFEKKQSTKTNLWKTSKFQLKQATRKSSKKQQLHKKTSPNSRENRKVGNTVGEGKVGHLKQYYRKVTSITNEYPQEVWEDG